MATRPGLAVAAAIVMHGQVLAARRTEPAALAGSWELPGGKVDAAEDPERAVVRELREELDCEVEVLRRLPGEQPLTGGHRLWVFECRLVGDGEPAPREHDAVRWLAPEELDQVGWLPADVPFVDALRERLLDGEPMAGGNVGGAVRIGSTVRRPTGPWTPAVHALLAHLDAVGLDGVPRVLGVDERGREVLTYLEGRPVEVDDEAPSDGLLVSAVEWLGRFHAAVATYRPAGVVGWRQVRRALAPDEVVCHNDPGAYNWVVAEGRFAGLIDWDLAGPGHPVDDLAFLAWTAVPLFRETPTDGVARRLRLVARTYGGVDPRDLLRASVERMETACERIAAGQAAGDPGMLALGRDGEPARTRDRIARLRVRLPTLESALSGE
ncbi:MAG: NUDIX domain-containing protein [Actinomycetota bacterium]|nr:NUDIX domain-containing protein [Actinomycetota bacterium]